MFDDDDDTLRTPRIVARAWMWATPGTVLCLVVPCNLLNKVIAVIPRGSASAIQLAGHLSCGNHQATRDLLYSHSVWLLEMAHEGRTHCSQPRRNTNSSTHRRSGSGCHVSSPFSSSQMPFRFFRPTTSASLGWYLLKKAHWTYQDVSKPCLFPGPSKTP